MTPTTVLSRKEGNTQYISLLCQCVSFLKQLNVLFGGGGVLFRRPSEPCEILNTAFWFLIRRHLCGKWITAC
jgi:hypothetical protein